ncbi:VanZ family protein [candidate division WWE3 bacterium]|nr:VanZ family protein [candidate division WWE3 bacterium]
MKTFLRWLPAIIMFVIIFYLSSRHGTLVTDVYILNYLTNKLAHVLIYFLLTITVYRGVKSNPKTFLIVLLYAISDEIHQGFVPTRGGRWRDVLLDAAASGYAILVLWKFYQYLPNKLKSWLAY